MNATEAPEVLGDPSDEKLADLLDCARPLFDDDAALAGFARRLVAGGIEGPLVARYLTALATMAAAHPRVLH
jgi:hypothetical protein